MAIDHNLWKQSFADIFKIGALKNKVGTYLEHYWKETPTQVFSCEYCEIFKNSFFIEHLWWLLLDLVISTFNPLLQNTPKWSDILKESHKKRCKIVNVSLNILRHYVLYITWLCNDVKIGFILLSLSWRRSLSYRNLSGFYMIRTSIMS